MDSILFDQVFDNNDNHEQQHHNDGTLQSDTIPLELRLQGLPNRPPTSVMKVASRLPLEMSGGVPSFLEDLQQLIRSKLMELHCPPSVTFDIVQTDDWYVDAKLFDRVREQYLARKRSGVWSLNVTVLSMNSGGATSDSAVGTSSSTITAPQPTTLTAAALQQIQNNRNINNNNITTLQQHQKPQQQQGNFVTNSFQQAAIVATRPMAHNPLHQQNLITRTVSIQQLKTSGNLNDYTRGTWTVTATVAEVRQKSESITELHLCQPEIDPRTRITAVCFNDAVSRKLRENVFRHCEVQIERASLQPKTDIDKRYQRDDHPYKIVLDGNTSVIVVRSAADNAGIAALLLAQSVVNNQNNNVIVQQQLLRPSYNNNGGVTANNNNNNNAVIVAGGFPRMQNNNNPSLVASSTTGLIQNASNASFRAGMNNPVSTSASTSSASFMNNNQQQQMMMMMTATAVAPRNNTASTSSTIFTRVTNSSSNSSSSNGKAKTFGELMAQKRMLAAAAATAAAGGEQQQQQPFEHRATLHGAPNPTRADIEARDGIVAIEASKEALEELTASTISLTNTNGQKKKIAPQLSDHCILCDVDSTNEDSIQELKRRLELVRRKCAPRQTAEEFIPSKMEDFQLLFSDPRILVKRKKLPAEEAEKAKMMRPWCKARVIDPISKKYHRIHPRCAHICWEYQQDHLTKLSQCAPSLDCKICELCGEAGAVTKCYDPTCDKWFHSSCAIFSKGYIDFGQYDPFRPCASCPQHAYLSYKKQQNNSTLVSNRSSSMAEAMMTTTSATAAGSRRNRKKNHHDKDDDDDEDDEEGAFDARVVEEGELRDPDEE